ncbi:hypothetical protein D3C85_1710930 [compost metagenome]
MDELEADLGDGCDFAADRAHGRQRQSKISQAEQEDPGRNGRRHAHILRDHPGVSSGA